MPRASSQGGRGTTPGAQPTVDEYGVSITPFQPTPFQTSENDSRIATERRIAANTMIHTEGPPIDTLQQHQSRRRIGQLPAQERLRPYAIPSTRTPSQHTSSRASMSTISLDDLNDDGTRSQRSQRAKRGSKQSAKVKPSNIAFYDENDKKNIYHARKLIVLDMILETGWEADRNILVAIAEECLSSACARNAHLTEPTAGVIKLVLDELSTVWGKLVQDAEGYLSALGLQHDTSTMSEEDQTARIVARANLILDEQNLQDYFLHGWDADREKILVFSAPAYLKFHEAFWFGRSSPFLNDSTSRARISKPSWFMYELTGAALYCIIRRAATGQLSKSQNTLHFTTQEFQPVALGIRNAIKRYLDQPELDDSEFLPRMTAHHEQCLKTLRSRTGEASPTKKYNIYVPSSSSELYRSRTSTSASTLSSDSLPSSLPNPLTSSSSSTSSNVSWYPGPRQIVDSPRVTQYTPCVPDSIPQGPFFYGHEAPLGSQPPQYYIPPVLRPYREPEASLDVPQHDGDDYFGSLAGSSSSLAGWGGNHEGSSRRGPLS
ncbi:uncharacterized protein F5891DRAFT_1193408 [Suillus fuscotomentosus]|uniref:DUF6532 domain-containing protein n=1 Tax=Suillus fuscotomentosus TaxID=1912939 RepID=A0AAD4HHZ1_9AGAM|nr:uncharacterized protein F5891DRAFT_1193408 [Suillus fuscotomentosus]KAG1896174.1 hypothetical protein F5891DRAFT_1193408 [Suillus fuscotomentosus]